MNWNEHFINLTYVISDKSKDESTKVGAIIVGKSHEIISCGYNGIARGLNDNDPVRQTRPLKYKYFEHAERNAIYNAARIGSSTLGSVIYCNLHPCSDCMRGIIQSGIEKVFVHKEFMDEFFNYNNSNKVWKEDMAIAASMASEVGLEIQYVSTKLRIPSPTINGKNIDLF